MRWLAGLAALAFVGAAAAQTGPKPQQEHRLERPPVWRSLERFESEAELLRYVRDVQNLQRVARGRNETDEIIVTGSAIPPPPPPPPPPPAPSAAAEASAPGDAVGAAPLTSITNVQTQGVDEGGIVKMVGRFLVILQDGRLFVADTRPGGTPGLALTGRANVYRSVQGGAGVWYDELLISGNRILVTGYSYREAASEITVFTIDDDGRLTRETSYFISSNDYYDPENYSTRLVNGNLVVYTPLNLMNVNAARPMSWPLIRRWLRDEDHRAITTAGVRLFDARDIYKPIMETRAPMVHSVSVCPLGDVRGGDELDCRTTGFVGPAQREFFVSTADIYLWVTPNDWRDQQARECPARAPGEDGYAIPAALYQVPLSGETPRALHTRGEPDSQLAMDASATEFRALLGWNTSACNRDANVALRYFHVPFSALSTTPGEAPRRSYTRVPGLQAGAYEVRFADTHVVYGSRGGYGSYPPDHEPGRSGSVVAVSTRQPTAALEIPTPHQILRVERVGADIALTGYRNDDGLSVSMLDLSQRPRLASTALLRGRYESENRSHAFNSLARPEGDGLMGLATVARVKESGRWVWRSTASDLSFLSFDAAGQIQRIGELTANPNAVDPRYRCEVSCVDWYGNSRALFIGDRVLALSGTELIEGAVEGGRIVERRRLNLSAPPPA